MKHLDFDRLFVRNAIYYVFRKANPNGARPESGFTGDHESTLGETSVTIAASSYG
jgi:hypothetical protein